MQARHSLTGAALAAWLATGLGIFASTEARSATPPGDGSSADPAELILENGIVHTSDTRRPSAQAIAVAHGRFVYVGSTAGAQKFAGPKSLVIDLHGQTVLPGIIDSHIHPDMGEFFIRRLCDVQSYTVDEGFAKLRACASKAPAGDWVGAFGWYGTDNPKLSSITLAQLDEIVPDRKLAVIERDAHTVWVNSRTLRALSISRDTPDPAGGRIDRDPKTGEATGSLHDTAGFKLQGELEHRSGYASPQVDLYRTVVPYLNSLGITSMLDAFSDDTVEAGYRDLDREGKLSMRVSMAFPVNSANYRTEIPRIAAKRAQNSPRIMVDFIKVFADGNAEDGLASLIGPDGRPEGSTHGYFTQSQMNEIVELAEANHLSIFVHSIGDGAARQVLDAVAAARKKSACAWCRHTLTHLQWIQPADMKRMKGLNVIANIQEGWLAPRAIGGPPGYDYVEATAAGPLGATRARAMYPFRRIRDAGARLSAGSDWWFTDVNPWNDLEVGATARDPGVPDSRPMLPDQTLEVKTLLLARTLGAAYQLQNDTETGSIAVGKRADFVVVDRDVLKIPPGSLHETHAVMTFFDGKQVAGNK